jgi:protein involved in polysaccharide export with SLBB domain
MEGCNASSARQRLAALVCMVRQIGFLILISSLTTALCAQQPSQGGNSGGSQSPSTWDCSDPLLASTPDCLGQSQEGASQLLTPQTRSLPPGEYGAQSVNPNSNYQAAAQNQRQQAQLPQEPLTEFQKFIASTTGQILPIYGAGLFRRVPSTFAPLDMTPVPSDYVIGPSDELRIHVWGQVNFQTSVRVDRSGEIFLPQIGPVHVAGMPFSALDAHLRGAIGRVYRNFDLTADVGQIRAIQVYVSGQARRPGVYTVSSLSTLVDTLFASGGPSLQGSQRHIQLRRGSAVVTDFDLYDLLIRGDKSKDVKLQSEDVIFIPPVGHQAAVTGSVRNPAIYELHPDESLASLLADAGGVTSVASEARVSIERIDDHRDRHAMEVAYDTTGLATPMADGDLVRVFSIVPMYSKTVILRGNIANPGRFAWHAGMHVSELIPDKDSLITRNYWWKRAQLGLPGPEFEPIPGFDNLQQPVDNHAITVERSLQESRSASNQSGYQQGQSGLQQGQSGMQQGQSGMQQGQSGLQQNPNLNTQQRAVSTSLASAQGTSATQMPAPEQRTEIRALAPEIDWDYAAIERFDPETLKSTVISFDLGKLVLQHDASQDLDLQAGDVVSIFSEADIRVPIAEQTKLVTLGGEFVHAGTYTAQPGETLRHLVERAGGVTPNAYMYGSDFTRQSTRVIQQARIDEYVQNLSMQIQRSSMLASGGSGPSQASVDQGLITSLRQIRATGRIVLRFEPDSSGTGSLPDIALEDGDYFILPPVPATVNVVGAVYNQNSFLYVRARKAGMYMQLAGGPNRDADKKHEFIIRADGEVVSHGRGKTIWSGSGFSDLRIYPGDTIVIPEKTYKPSVLNNVMNWTQVGAQLATVAALITVLK